MKIKEAISPWFFDFLIKKEFPSFSVLVLCNKIWKERTAYLSTDWGLICLRSSVNINLPFQSKKTPNFKSKQALNWRFEGRKWGWGLVNPWLGCADVALFYLIFCSNVLICPNSKTLCKILSIYIYIYSAK